MGLTYKKLNINNSLLQKKYNLIYKKGASKFFTFPSSEEKLTILKSASWNGKVVLEVGCGEGDLALMIARRGATVIAIDYSLEAIKIAKAKHNNKKINFYCKRPEEIKDKFNMVVMEGVLEHLDKPCRTLKYIRDNLLADKNSEIISSSPSFLNPRGYIWMTLQLLFGIPMSLTDKHFLCPFDYEEFAAKLGMRLTYKSCDHDRSYGKRLIIDFKRRLPNALRDAGMKGNVDNLLSWLDKAKKYHNFTEYSGTNIVYRLFFNS